MSSNSRARWDLVERSGAAGGWEGANGRLAVRRGASAETDALHDDTEDETEEGASHAP